LIEPEAERFGESTGPTRDQFLLRVAGKPTKRPHASQPLERFGGSK
jgi:hypothetical protein